MSVVLSNPNSAALQYAAKEFEKYFSLVCDSPEIEAAISTAKFDNDEHFEIHACDGKVNITGGRERACIYGVYEYFRLCFGCFWYWDGDRLPDEKQEFKPFDYSFTPAFGIRGLRYFAHRGCYRFRAELWSEDDWKREISFLLKSMFNFFMLRTGQDDLWQRAFPEKCAYPPDDECGDEDEFYDRTNFHSLKSRGELRQRICLLASELDLLRPVDCGTMTHWYSPTPADFSAKVNPPLLKQDGALYSKKALSVFDIRTKRGMNYYLKLTDTEVRDFGSSNIFHTIGLAERLPSADRAENLALKTDVYNRICAHLKEKYPNYKLLVAGWDFTMHWTPEEVRSLISKLDENQCMIFDYTADSDEENGCFLNWGVKNAFPYLLGIFHGYAPNDEIRGDYDVIAQRLEGASSDAYCKGLTTWQELSHGDPVLLSYLARVSRTGITETSDEVTANFAKSDFPAEARDEAAALFAELYPLSRLVRFRFNRSNPEYNIFRDWFVSPAYSKYGYNLGFDKFDDKEKSRSEFYLPKYEEVKKHFQPCIHKAIVLYGLVGRDSHAVRCIYDAARTAVSRYLCFELLRIQRDYFAGNDMKERCASYYAVAVLYTALLGTHTDYSACDTLSKLASSGKVNPNFEATFKKNIANDYCIGNCYETLRMITLPQLDRLFSKLCGGDRNYSDVAAIYDEFYRTPLSAVPREKRCFCDILREIELITEE